jgi:dihydroxyacetone kinase-like predicted kinase
LPGRGRRDILTVMAMEAREVKAAMERLRAAVRESVKGPDQGKFLTVIDALQGEILSSSQDSSAVRSHLQQVRDTSRRVLRVTPQSMVRILKAVDGVEGDLQKILDALGGS